MELDFTVSFADQYKINPREYVDVNVTSLPFSTRITNRFQGNNITTVAELLEKTPADLMQISGFGRGCLVEIDKLFSTVQGEALPQPVKKARSSANLIRQYRHRIIQGDFAFVEEDELTDKDKEVICEIQEAYDTLGSNLVDECVANPAGIQNIVLMLQKFCFSAKRSPEIDALMKSIPTYRRQNLAHGYINAFTQDENKREMLASQYGSEDAVLGCLIGNRLDDETTFIQVKKFLKWCAFDLTEDVATLITAVTGQGKLQTVVEMRARKFTLEKCGNKLHVTRERIRQLELKALHIFARYQARIKLIAKISAEKNGDAIITPADIERYSGDHSTELLFLLRNYKSGTYTYDDQLDVFVIGDDSLHDRVYAFVENLPEMFSIKKIPEYLETAKEENDLPASMVEMAISEAYKLTGEVYHRSRLSLATIYTAIMQEHYPNGIKAYDPAEISRFRKLVLENYGDVRMPENDRALTARIAGICILCGRGMYKLKQKQYIPKSLAKRIYEYIVYGDDRIYLMNTLFSVFETDLRKSGVDNKYFLQGILHELYGDELIFTRDYVSTDEGETSIYASVVAFIEESRYPVSKAQIQKKFPGITNIVINFSVSNPSILNYFGEYLHTSKLHINPEEERYLDKVVRRVCMDGMSHHVKDFYEIINQEKPEILTRNAALYPFSAFSVLEYLFRDSYQFSRPYIALRDVEIGRPAERLHDLLYGMDEFTFDDISDFAKENHFMIQSQLDYVNSCNDKFLIINGTTVRSIDRIGVNAEIASVVEMAVAKEVTETVPISQLTCWASFPHVNTPWTEWLVYSVLNKWGTFLSVAPSSNQFRFSIPLVAPRGKIDTVPYSDAYKDASQASAASYAAADDLENIDDILAEILGDELLEDDLWD